MSRLLALPDEILVQTLCNLSLRDIFTTQRTCFKLNAIVNHSTEIQYQIALELAGMEDNRACYFLSPAEKLERLDKVRRAWKKVEPEFVQQVKVVNPASGIYDLTGGVYLLGDNRKLDLHCLILPDRREEEAEEGRWMSIGVEEVIIDIGLCIDEHDLIVVVTTTQMSTDPALYDIGLHFIQFSTGKRHPLAKHHRITAHKSKYAKPPVGIEIVGENIVLVLAQFLDPLHDASQPEDRVFVFEWQTGTLTMSVLAPYRSYSGIIFLDEHLVLLPNTQRGVLEIWDLPRSSAVAAAPSPSPSAPLCILELPLLAPGRSFGPLSCRAEPSPIGAKSVLPRWDQEDPLHEKRRRKAFKARAEDAIIVFNVRIQPLQTGPHPIAAVVFSHIYTFFVHRRSILRVVQEEKRGRNHQRKVVDIDFPSNSVLFPEPVPWEEWGPKTTRWLEADDVPTRWITTTAGQRAVLISSHARNSQGSGSPIVVMDFNAWNVTRLLNRREERRKRTEEVRAGRRRRRERAAWRRFRECAEWVESVERALGEEVLVVGLSSMERVPDSYPPPPLAWPELEGWNIEEVKIFLERHHNMVERLEAEQAGSDEYMDVDEEDGSSDSDTDDDSDTEVDSPSRPAVEGTAARIKQPKNWWCLDNAQLVDRAGVCFASPVVSELPCLGYTSKGRFHYDGVLMDEERILGITTNRVDRIKSVEVQYFG